ncbi:MAG: toprim domain-containing protein [Acidobacteria bacterium]|nr:toprim domain-containing protein [Acidobacteriota bacterium]
MESAEQTTSRADTVERLHEQLQTSLQELVTSEDWQRALAVAARFHDYSFANTQLIWAQSLARGATPSRVAGYRTWQQLGRQVRRGERGLQILAPLTRRITPENSEDEERRVVGFRVVHVFDLAQTDGEPLPEVKAALVEGDLPAHWDRVGELITGAGFGLQVADVDRLGEANGITDWQQRDVIVRASLPGAQRFKTAVHELAHIRLHEPTTEGRPNCRGIVEVEAESVAYVVCAALGIDSTGYSLPYVASWSGGDVDKVAETANRVMGCARGVLTQLEHAQLLEHGPVGAKNIQSSKSRSREAEETTPSPDPPNRTGLEEVLSAATSIYRDHLRGPKGAPALDFLHQRGIDEEAANTWQLGYAPASWRTLIDVLHNEGFADEILLESGVVGRARTGRLYDRMRGRLIFPIFDESGAPRGFAGRLITGDGPKYVNTPETDLYQKRSLLYGIHRAGQPIVDARQVVVVEGYTDAIAAHQAGFTNVVAIGGTAMTPQHLEILERITTTITLAFDGDQAGLLAAQRTAELDRAGQGVHLRVARLATGQDPAELLAGGGGEIFQEAIAGAVPLEHHLIDQIVRHHNLEEPDSIARAIHAAGSVVLSIADPAAQAQAVTYLATRVGRDDAVIQGYLEDRARPPARGRSRSHGRSIA